MPGNLNPSNTSAAKDAVAELNEILRQWDEEQAVAGSDPTPHLVKLCELFELHTQNFLKRVNYNLYLPILVFSQQNLPHESICNQIDA